MKRADLKAGQEYLETGSHDWDTGGYSPNIERVRVIDASKPWELVGRWGYNREVQEVTVDGVTYVGNVTDYLAKGQGVLVATLSRETGEPSTDAQGRIQVTVAQTSALRTTWEDGQARLEARRERERQAREATRRREAAAQNRRQMATDRLQAIIPGAHAIGSTTLGWYVRPEDLEALLAMLETRR